MNRDPRRRGTGAPGFPPDPSKYDMYAAFRTKERAEERAAKQAKRRSLYDVGTKGTVNGQPGAQSRRTDTGGAGVYRINRPKNGDPRQKSPRQSAAAARQQQSPAVPARQRNRTVSGTPSAPVYGTRVESGSGETNLYGNHSSYRTSDGRILDGFDKSGRPIYREDGASGTGAVVRRTAAAPDAVHLHPVRRIRVETLEDTERKPFPFLTVLAVFLCTALVMGVLYTYMTLNECTNTMSVLSYRLSNLRAQVNTLSAEVVRREDLIAIEQTASDILGMVKNDVLTKRYVSIENEDKTEVVSKVETGSKKRVAVEIDLDTGRPAVVSAAESNP